MAQAGEAVAAISRLAWRRGAIEHVARAHLTPRQRRCLVLACFDGLTQGEIAARLGLSMRAVRQVMHRARRKLAKVGLKAERVKVLEQDVVCLMDPAHMDRLPPRQIRGRW